MKIWIDIDNSPHVPFFTPIIKRLREQQHDVWITTRKYAQTLELLNASGFPFIQIGEHAGKNTVKKILNLLGRSRLLARAARLIRPDIAVSHGSRAQVLSAKMLGIPSLVLFDYEWTEMHLFKRLATRLACPSVLDSEILHASGIPQSKVKYYSGLKEDVYLPFFKPDPRFVDAMKWPKDKIVVVVRPSSMVSNYHDSKSEQILAEVIKTIGRRRDIFGYVTPRTSTDTRFVLDLVGGLNFDNIQVAEKAVDGMQLIFWCDMLFSGGGTMNREAALLGVPTLSLFTGRRPAIDQYLAERGMLRFLQNPEDVVSIQFRKREKSASFRYPEKGTLQEVCDLVIGLLS